MRGERDREGVVVEKGGEGADYAVGTVALSIFVYWVTGTLAALHKRRPEITRR